MKLLLQIALSAFILFLSVESSNKTKVVASLYDNVTLRCSFPFIQGPEDLSVVWKKDQNGRKLIAHKFKDGQDHPKDQHKSYTGRTELSGDFSEGTVDLTLQEVTFNDEGTYHCQAANKKGNVKKKVELTIDKLNAEDPKLAIIHINGMQRLQCIAIGVFRNPKIQWSDEHQTDLSKYGTHNITDISNGRKMVTSVLNMDVETNKLFVCKVREGRLKRTARAVLSDKAEMVASLYGTVTLPCSFFFIQGLKGLSVVWEKYTPDGRVLIVHKFIKGQDNLLDQDMRYTGRTELSGDFSQGKVDLILREVTFDDKGTYQCRVANEKTYGSKMVDLTIKNETEVVTSLYATVTLRCWFPFIHGLEGLSVVWEKTDQEGRTLIAHKFIEGQDNLRDQDKIYTGRTELSGDFSEGTVDLKLQEVTFNDEGTYHCRAANKKDHGNQKVKLTIDKLNAENPSVTAIHIDGKKRLKCINIGVFRNPWVRWYDEQGRDLSEYGTRKITDIRNGRKMVTSVLNLDVETNRHYFCLLKEGRLKRTARAVLSDGKPMSFPEIKLPE